MQSAKIAVADETDTDFAFITLHFALNKVMR